eukprot:3431484-Amphidinium_carterae.1
MASLAKSVRKCRCPAYLGTTFLLATFCTYPSLPTSFEPSYLRRRRTHLATIPPRSETLK